MQLILQQWKDITIICPFPVCIPSVVFSSCQYGTSGSSLSHIHLLWFSWGLGFHLDFRKHWRIKQKLQENVTIWCTIFVLYDKCINGIGASDLYFLIILKSFELNNLSCTCIYEICFLQQRRRKHEFQHH